MVEAAEELLEKMKRGEITGWMFVASTPHGNDTTGVFGAYADRLQYAVYSATKGLNALVDQVAASPSMGHTESGPLQGQHAAGLYDELPMRLRTGTC